MSGFIGGSAYTMVRDIAEGYIIASELTFKKFQAGEFQQFGFEADKLLREVRGDGRARRGRRGHAEAAPQDAAAAAGDDDRQQRAREAALTSGAPPRSRPARELGLAALFFLAITVLMTWPQAAHLDDALSDVWDAKLNARILHWDYAQTLRDPLAPVPAQLLSPGEVRARVLGEPVRRRPLRLPAARRRSVGARQLQRPAPAGDVSLGARGLGPGARDHGGSDRLGGRGPGVRVPAVAIQPAAAPPVPVGGRFSACRCSSSCGIWTGGRSRDLVAFGICFAWNALCNVHYALFSGLLVGVTLALFVVGGAERDRRRWKGALVATLLGGLVFVPFALPYREASRLYGMRRYFGEMRFYSARWTYFLSAGDRNWLYGHATERWRGAEGDLFPGLLALTLAAAAVVQLLRAGPPRIAGQRPAVSSARLRLARALDAVILCSPASGSGPWHGRDCGSARCTSGIRGESSFS